MNKFELAFKYSESTYNESVSRRDKIRSRAHLLSAFDFSIITILITQILNNTKSESYSYSYLTIIFIVLSLLMFISYLVFYILTFGAGRIKRFFPDEILKEIMNVVDLYPSLFDELYFDYSEFGIDHPLFVAENDIALYHLSTIYNEHILLNNKANNKLTLFFLLMSIFIFSTILLLFISMGVS